ncbi:MAG: fumarylacetoacetate hydrolase family protein [Candidatus Altiarchaeota archaeon]|nr:fumarylacetoacetate hydrolase family protein [Candidatus Altiarchaeota archaeon]
MKLVRFEHGGRVLTGRLVDDEVFALGGGLFNPGKEAVESCNAGDVRFLSPVQPSKIICIGFNYRKHMDEARDIATKNPTLTLKSPDTVIGGNDSIILPKESAQVEHEAELGIVIGREGYKIRNPGEHILGYTIVNDVTARDLEKEMVQWSASKSFPTFCPVGPCIETELDPADVRITCRVNNEVRQDERTRHMIYDPLECVVFVSRFMRLYPGDLIATGTIPGVGLLSADDVVEVGVEGIGILRNPVESE